jgi:hypothetical protein
LKGAIPDCAANGIAGGWTSGTVIESVAVS